MKVIDVGYQVCKPFVLRGHYAGRMPQISRAFGLVEGESVVGVVTFGQPASPWVKRSPCGPNWEKMVWELNRLVVSTGTKNAASFLVGAALARIGDHIVVSYADCGAGHVGCVYQATNWLYCGSSKPRTDKFSESGHSRHYAEGETRRTYRSAKHRYLTFTGNKRFKREARRAMVWFPRPYPKGDSLRHDVERIEVPVEPT